MRYTLHLIITFAVWLVSGTLMATEPVMIWVEFTDKNHSTYSLSRPHEFLSPKAIQRRQNQNISIDFYDLPVSDFYINKVVEETGMELHYTSKWFNGAMFTAETTDPVAILSQLDFVTLTEIAKSPANDSYEKSGTQQEQITEKAAMQYFNERVFPYSGTYDSDINTGYGTALGQVNMVNGQSLHQQGYWGNGTVIAVIDAGFRGVDTLSAFENLWKGNQILGYHDFSRNKKELYLGHNHGTFVLSVMAAKIPGMYSGVATAASYWLIRTEDASSEFRVEEYNWLAGAEFADSVGVDIINSSLGYTIFDNPAQNYSYQDMDGNTTVVARAANMAFSRGMLVVNSAGNYGSQSWQYIGSPADAPGSLAVGGTNSEGLRASFSSVGPTYDGRISPQIMAQGQGVAVVNTMGVTGNANGTSFSAPIISGLAACLWEMFPDASNEDIKQAIISSSNNFLNPDSLYGYGIPNFTHAISMLERELMDTNRLRLLTNPLQPTSSIEFYAYQQEKITIELFNSSGHKIWQTSKIMIYPGYNKIKPFRDIASLSQGMYLIRVNFANSSEMVKAVKL